MEIYYRRHLPHYQPLGATYFTTFRLAGSLPAEVIRELLHEREAQKRSILTNNSARQRFAMIQRSREAHFKHLENALDHAIYGPHWLLQTTIAEVVERAIRFRDATKYDLYAYCLMPNHVHLVFKLLEEVDESLNEDAVKGIEAGLSYPVTDILGSLKKHTALEANRKLGRQGAFWQDESYDHVVRDGDELERILWYVILNPVKAGLVRSWRDWMWSYCKQGLLPLLVGSQI